MEVLKTIRTPRHCWNPGDTLDPADLDGPLTLADWQRLGHLPGAAAPDTPAPEAAEAAAPPVPTRAAKDR